MKVSKDIKIEEEVENGDFDTVYLNVHKSTINRKQTQRSIKATEEVVFSVPDVSEKFKAFPLGTDSSFDSLYPPPNSRQTKPPL